MTVSSPGAPGSRAFGRCRGADELPDDGQGQDPDGKRIQDCSCLCKSASQVLLELILLCEHVLTRIFGNHWQSLAIICQGPRLDVLKCQQALSGSSRSSCESSVPNRS